MNGMRNKLSLMAAAMLCASAACAQLLVEPSFPAESGAWQAGGSHQFFQTTYEIDTIYPRLRTPEFSRDLYSVHGAYGLPIPADVFVAAALTDDADNSDHPAISGDGHALAIGSRGLIFEHMGFGLVAWGQLMWMREEYSPEPVDRVIHGHNGYVNDRTITWTELTLGLLARYATERFSVYAGPEVLAVQWGDYDYTSTYLDDGTRMDADTLDVERDDIWGFRIGGRFSHQSFFAYANLAFGYETSWTIGIGASF